MFTHMMQAQSKIGSTRTQGVGTIFREGSSNNLVDANNLPGRFSRHTCASLKTRKILAVTVPCLVACCLAWGLVTFFSGFANLVYNGQSAQFYENNTTYLPLIVKTWPKDPSMFDCNNLSLHFTPDKASYSLGEIVAIDVQGAQPADGALQLRWARTSANTGLSSPDWERLALSWNAALSRYETSWPITDTLAGAFPFDQSAQQEFLVAITLRKQAEANLLCAPNLDATAAFTPAIYCPTCSKILTTREAPPDLTIDLAPYWNVKPGYAVTYVGERFDRPEEEDGTIITPTFVTRMEYEAPMVLCTDTPLIPQRWTKNSHWGYWNPRAAQRADRDGTFWTEGNTNLRFFLTDEDYDYAWESQIRGAYAHKIYGMSNDSFTVDRLGDILYRTIIHTNRNQEHQVYPPYLLSLAAVSPTASPTASDQFTRIDSLYHYQGSEAPDPICTPRIAESNHNWHTRAQLLTNPEVQQTFGQIQSFFTDSAKIVVLTFFEGGDFSDGQAVLREDWYLMEGIGLVGIDQARWDKNDAQSETTYVNTTFMQPDGEAKPQMRMRADRAYLGHPLEITPLAPGASFPMTVTASSCYTVAIHSTTATPIPYDGLLEHDGSGPPSLWSGARDGKPHWAEKGIVVECLPAEFPSGEYKVRLRPHITKSPSAYEHQQDYQEMPWSANYLWIRVPAQNRQ